MKLRTKIVATLGPSVAKKSNLLRLLSAGVDVVRINCAHGNWEIRKQWIEIVREYSEKKNRAVAVLVDLSGPKIRLGEVPGKKITVKCGDIITFALKPNGNQIGIPIPELFKIAKVGSRILIGDGYVEAKALNVSNTIIEARIANGGDISSRQGITLVGDAIPLEAVTDKDREDVYHAIQNNADYVALSYVRSADDIRNLRSVMISMGAVIPIIAKIETREAVKAISSVIKESEAIMVARGDLGLQLDISHVPILQKEIINATVIHGKPVITATQMLESMLNFPRPTRAETTDVANSIFDGTSAVMLSGETAAGQYPIESVKMMSDIIRQTEYAIDRTELEIIPHKHRLGPTESVAHAACELAATIGAKAIIATTTSGHTARMVAKFRPKAPIICVTPSKATFRRMALVWGVNPLLVGRAEGTDEMINSSIEAAVQNKFVKIGDSVVITAGTPSGIPGSTNLIHVRKIEV